MKYDVFISCKSEDYNIGRQVYEFLVNHRDVNLNVFMADKELRRRGNADYGRVIDEALDSSTHLIIVASNADYLKEETSSYVYEEWHTFVEEIRSGRKKGNILTIFTEDIKFEDVPIALRNRQSFPFTEFSSIIDYLPQNKDEEELAESTIFQADLDIAPLVDDIELDLDYDDAVDFMQDGELQDAMHSLQASFENENSKTIPLFNKLLFQDFGKTDWDEETWEFLKRETKAGHSFAHLAFFYKYQHDKQLHKKAIEHLKAALADKQNGYAFLCEGIAREKGIGTRANLRSAMKRYEQAYKMGIFEACSYVAEMYLNGNSGVEIKEDKANAILEKGCEQNDARSFYVMAKIYSSDLKQSGNFEKAVELYQKAASLKMHESWIELGKLYQDNIYYIGNRWDKAAESYYEAIKNGVKDGHAYLARLYWKQQRYTDARIEAERGMKNGSTLSLSVLGEIYEEGMPDMDKLIVVHIPDIPQAWHYYKQAFESGGRIEDAVSLARLYVNEEFRPDDMSWEIIEGYLEEGARVPLREAIELMVKALRANGKEEDAQKYIKIGAESGILDMMYEYGIRAMSTNTGEALRLLSTAGTKGHISSILKNLEHYKNNNIKTEYEKWMDIAYKYNVEVPIEDFAEYLYFNRPNDLWLYLKNIYTNQNNYLALYWMAYYMLHKLQIEKKEQEWLYETFIAQFANIALLETSAYDIYAKMICTVSSDTDFEHNLENVHEKYRDYIRYWQLIHNTDNINDGEALMESISQNTKQYLYNLSNEWLQKFKILGQKAFTRGIHTVIIGNEQTQVFYLRDILDFYDFNVSYSLDTNIINQIEPQDSGKLLFLVLHKNKNEMPQTFVQGHSIVAYIDIEKELDEARSSIGKTRAIREELIANRLNAYIYNLVINSKQTNDIEESRKKVILHCEDEDSNHDLLRVILAKRYKILRAKNGIEAVVICEESHPDLVYMDIRMYDMDGLDATRIIKEVNPQIPIVALSAYAFDENIRKALDAGMDEFLVKPFKVEDLLECTRRYIG